MPSVRSTPRRRISTAWFTSGGVGDVLKAFQFTDAQLGASPVSQSSNGFGYPGATPSISSNGMDSGIVWATESVEGTLAVLHAYDANNLADELYNSNQAGDRDHFGEGNKFITPVIANGEVFVGTTDGVGVFGLLGGGGAARKASGPASQSGHEQLDSTRSVPPLLWCLPFVAFVSVVVNVHIFSSAACSARTPRVMLNRAAR